MLHGAVDDYFDLIKFLQWSTNNKALTSTTLCDYPLKTHSLSSTVRTDEKEESILI